MALLFIRAIAEMIFLLCFRVGCAGHRFPFPQENHSPGCRAAFPAHR